MLLIPQRQLRTSNKQQESDNYSRYSNFGVKTDKRVKQPYQYNYSETEDAHPVPEIMPLLTIKLHTKKNTKASIKNQQASQKRKNFSYEVFFEVVWRPLFPTLYRYCISDCVRGLS